VPATVADAIRRGLAPRPEDRWPRVDALLVALSGDASGRRKRRMLGAAVLGVAVVGVVARQWTSVPDDDRCTGAAEALVGVWDAARRDELRTAVLRVEVPYAARVWERTAAALDAYAKDWIAQHTEACEATTIRGEQSAEVMDLRMSCLHRARVDLAAVTGVLASADADVVANAHDLVHRLRPLQRCTDIEALRADVEPPSPEEAEAVEAIRVGVAEAVAEEEAGRYDAARAKIEAAREALEGIDYAPARTEVAAEYGSVLERLGRYEESEAVLLEALELATTWRQLDLMRDVASALMFVVGRRRQRFDEALRYRELALGLATGEPRAEMVARGNLASVLLAMGDYAGAEIEVRRSIEQGVIAYGSDHHKVANGRATLAVILNKQGRYGEAETSLGSAIELLERALGPDHPAVCNARANLGAVLEHQGRYAEAEAEYRRALDRLAASVEPDHPSVCTARASLANALRKQEDAEGAEAEYRQAIACLLRSYEPDHRDVLMARTNLGAVLLDQKRYEQAEQEQRGIVALYERALGPEHPDTAAARIQLGNALYMHGEHDEAEIEHRRALAILERALGPDHLATALARSNVARVLLARGEFDDAVVFAEQAWARRQQPDVPPTQRAAAAIVLAQALWEVNASPEQRTRARTLAESADEIFRAAGPAFADEAQTVEDWLADPKPVVEL
jgi:tetratricopeptide (TPR) repeat protein